MSMMNANIAVNSGKSLENVCPPTEDFTSQMSKKKNYIQHVYSDFTSNGCCN